LQPISVNPCSRLEFFTVPDIQATDEVTEAASIAAGPRKGLEKGKIL
jgi:hypothetical protein